MKDHTSNEKNVHNIELIIGIFLRIGIILSSIIILTGLIMFLTLGYTGYSPNYYPTSPLEILKDSIYLKPYAIIMLGLLSLILIPMLRVAISILVFLKEKDFLYVKITTLVLLILILSFFTAR
ncbi:DUF1634 domain-containing protein [Clostridium sp. BJN0013]|uniref:DUF1634 domain-containing protein n=1 Tax=Clostridium sp. BJN0013 TaxID=3236840 RepID=UPI0034C5EF2E